MVMQPKQSRIDYVGGAGDPDATRHYRNATNAERWRNAKPAKTTPRKPAEVGSRAPPLSLHDLVVDTFKK